MKNPLVVRLAIAALVGLAMGIEREWSGHARPGPGERFAGVRTFLLIGTTGGIAGWFASQGMLALASALVLGASLLIAAAYWAVARRGEGAVDGTTEVAALAAIALGALAGMGEVGVAAGGGAILVLALSEKSRVHDIVQRIDGVQLRAAVTFAVLATVILPILPDRDFGPLGGVNPRALWIIVLIFSGLNFAGWVARRAVGASRGYGVTGALGGVISSTAVTLQFSRASRTAPQLAAGLGVGVVAACTVLLPRVVVLSAVLNRSVALALLPYLALPFGVGVALSAFWLARARREPHDGLEGEDASPLRLWSAIKLTLAFQAALMALHFVSARFGSAGVLTSAAILGLTDMDALNVAMNRLGRDPTQVLLAARAIAVGVAANTVLKLAMSLALGTGRFRAVASVGLAALLTASIAAFVVLS